MSNFIQNNHYGKNEINSAETKIKSSTTVNIWRYRTEGVVGTIIAGALVELIRYLISVIFK